MLKRLVAGALALAGPATAAELRDFCPDRPGRDTPACVVDVGHVIVETGLDWTRDRTRTSTTTMLAVADTMVRAGVTDHLEIYAEWSPYNRVEVRPRGGRTTTVHGVGDVTLGVKQSLLHPDGKGLSIAVQPFVTAPTAKDAIGDGKWTQGLIVPVTLELADEIEFSLSPEIDRLPDSDGHGHHAQYVNVASISRQIGTVTPGVELYVSRDDDPGNRSTQATADVFAAWIPASAPNLQFDAGAYIGLNRATPDIELLIGVARRF